MRYVQTIAVNEPYEHLSLEGYLIRDLNPPDNTLGVLRRLGVPVRSIGEHVD